jgi:multidrug efflux pump subunit AcrB
MIVSTAFTLLLIPVVYYLLYGKKQTAVKAGDT